MGMKGVSRAIRLIAANARSSAVAHPEPRVSSTAVAGSRASSIRPRKPGALKSKVRASAEHCFGVMKRVFGFTKVRYRGINKNADWLFATCALVNLFMVRRRLLAV